MTVPPEREQEIRAAGVAWCSEADFENLFLALDEARRERDEAQAGRALAARGWIEREAELESEVERLTRLGDEMARWALRTVRGRALERAVAAWRDRDKEQT